MINREPASTHLRDILAQGFRVVCERCTYDASRVWGLHFIYP
jgi:hypothetical protein